MTIEQRAYGVLLRSQFRVTLSGLEDQLCRIDLVLEHADAEVPEATRALLEKQGRSREEIESLAEKTQARASARVGRNGSCRLPAAEAREILAGWRDRPGSLARSGHCTGTLFQR